MRGRGKETLLAPLLATGALLVLSYPPVSLGWLAYVALVPFLWWLSVIEQLRLVLWSSAIVATVWASGLFYFTLAIHTATWLERAGAYTAVVAVFVVQAMLFSVGAWFFLRYRYGPMGRRGRRTHSMRAAAVVFLLATWWLGTEWLTQRLAFGLAAHLGVTQWRYPTIVNLARWVGLQGISGLLVAVNGAVLLLCQAIRQRWLRRAGAPAGIGLLGLASSVGRRASLAVALQAAIPVLTCVVLILGAWYGALRPAGIWPTGTAGSMGMGSQALAGRTLRGTEIGGQSCRPCYSNTCSLECGEPGGGEAGSPHASAEGYLKLALVQSGFTLSEYSQAAKSDLELRRLFEQLLRQSRGAAAAAKARQEEREQLPKSQGPDHVLVVWPETVLHEPLLNCPDYASIVAELAREERIWILAGLPWLEGDRYSNAAVLLTPEGSVAGRYDKVRTIPVAEMWAAPGSQWQPIRVAGMNVGVGMCSELIDPRPSRALVEAGAELIVFLSSLDHLGRSSAPALQAAFVPFRAAETGRFVAQVGSVGLTLVAAPNGVIQEVLPGREPSILPTGVPRRRDATLYVYLGDIPAIGALVLGLVMMVRVRRNPLL